MLRNRHTGETWKIDNKKLTKVGLFKNETLVESKQEPELDLLNEFIDDFKTRLPKNLSQNEKDEIIKKVEETCRIHAKDVLKHSQALLAMIEKQDLKNENPTKKSFLSNLGNLETAAFAPLVLAAASLSPVAAAATVGKMAASYVIHEGVPPGGLDLCSGILFGCAQGYLTEGTQPWNMTMPQFNRVVQQIGSGDAPLDARETLRKCMDNTKTGETLVSSLTSTLSSGNVTNSTSPHAVCSAESSQWQSWQLTSQARNIPSTSCSNYQNLFAVNSQNCMTFTGRVKELGVIIGVSVGAVLACGLCYVAFRYCRKKMEDQVHDNYVRI